MSYCPFGPTDEVVLGKDWTLVLYQKKGELNESLKPSTPSRIPGDRARSKNYGKIARKMNIFKDETYQTEPYSVLLLGASLCTGKPHSFLKERKKEKENTKQMF